MPRMKICAPRGPRAPRAPRGSLLLVPVAAKRFGVVDPRLVEPAEG
jgi:hypothetical protein